MSYLVTYLNIAPKASIPHADFPIAVKNAIGKLKHETVMDIHNIKDRLFENQGYLKYKSRCGIYLPDTLTLYDQQIAEYFDIFGGELTINSQSHDLTMVEYEIHICIYRIKHIELLTPELINNPKFNNLFKYDYLNRNNILNMTWHNYRLNVYFINNLHLYEPSTPLLDISLDISALEKSGTKLFAHQFNNLGRMITISLIPKTIQISNEMVTRFENNLIYEIGNRQFISSGDHNYEITGGMILDEPGTGKTLQFILYILNMQKLELAGKALVLVPNDNIKSVWVQEYLKHIEPDLYNTYESLSSDTIRMPFDIFTFHELESRAILTEYDIIGIDEIHNLYKCHRPISKFYDNLYKLIVTSPIKYRWGITGTPFVNDSSLFSIIKFLTGQNFANERLSNDPYIQDEFMHLFLKNRKIDMITDDYVWPEVNIHDIRVNLDVVQQRIYDTEVMLNKSDKNKLRRMICNINLMFDSGEFRTPAELKTYGIQHYNNLYEAEKAKLERLTLQLENIEKHRTDFKCEIDYITRYNHFKNLVQKQEGETERHKKVCEYFLSGIEEINRIVLAKPATMQSGDEMNNDSTSEEQTCKICWSEYTLPIIYFKPCGHYFCSGCIQPMWGEGQSINCPMCRREIQKSDTINVNTMSEINDSSKIHALFQIIEPETKYIIFTQFHAVIQRIQQYLTGRGITSSVLDKYSGEQVLMLSSEQNAEGINLSHFDKMIIFEPFEANVYSGEVERQLIARIHRVGRTRPVDVYRMITVGTVEEEIYNYY